MFSTENIESKCHGAALNFIANRPRTEKEVYDKLKVLLEKHYGKGSITLEEGSLVLNKVISSLRDGKLLNDEEYAKTYVSQSIRKTNPLSKFEIISFLARKGVNKAIITDALSLYDDDVERKSIEKIVKKRIKNPIILTDTKMKAKHINYLVRRGFSYNLAYEVLSNSI